MNRQIQLTAANCAECIKAGKNIKPIIQENEITKLITLEEPKNL